MRYSDLIQFDPIESVVQLRESDKKEKAQELVRSYVISKDMAERLSGVFFANLLLEGNPDTKGVLVVGNYGSGKSHLMSVISAIAEDASALEGVDNETVRKAAEKFAGRYKVIRMEIGSTTMGLREILTGSMTKQLAAMGVDYVFPAAHEVSENKSSIEDMMAAFHKVYAKQGLLVIVDELLDYLRGRKEQELVLDLGFLREVGEVCKTLKFRFMAGVQEAIFDSGRFAFAGDSIGRVKARFEQIHIATSDVKFVVANRLLKKTAAQKKSVRTYLEKFAKYYGDWNERMEDLVDLFPVHPDYIDTFQRAPIVEKRGVLQVLSRAISARADTEVPDDVPGILAADGFWSHLVDEPAYRSIPDVKAVLECTTVLEDKVKSAFPKKQYKPMALRIIHGLSVHRLTTNDIHLPIGLTPEELRDRLCLFHPMAGELGGAPADDLLSLVEVTLKEIRTTVSGQFVSQNPDNRQVYLDLKKTDDYDALIEKKAEILSDDALDRGYYLALTEILECSDPTSFTGFRVWERDIQWTERKTSKRGWLFFGVPSERSTANPPRDFYLYFIQPFSPPKYTDEKKADEVFFKLDDRDAGFTVPLRLYAAALDLAGTSTGQKKQAYSDKSLVHFKALTKWLREKFLTAIQVTHEGKKKNLSQALAGANAAGLTPVEQIFTAASRQLTGHFASICGDYPTFSRLITFGRDGNAIAAVQDALRGLSGNSTQTGIAILDGLGLMNGEKIDPYNSPYAKHVIDLLDKKGHGQVLNRSELIQDIYGVPYFVAPGKFRLEPELLVVVLGALIHSGDVILSLPGKEFSATDLKEMAGRSLDDLTNFKHIKKPKDWNIPAIKALFELLSLPSGLAVQVTQNDPEPVVKLNVEVIKQVEALVTSKQEFGHGIPFWGHRLLADDEITALAASIDKAKDFLESLQAYKTPGQLKNFRYSSDEVKALEPVFESVKVMGELKGFANTLSEYTAYLTTAESILPETHAWRAGCQAAKKKLRDDVVVPANRKSDAFRKKAIQTLKDLKADYITAYLELYQHARLDTKQDKRKAEILSDFRMDQLKQLAGIPSINRSQLIEIQDEFGNLKTGETLTASDIETNPTCGDFFPAMEKGAGISAEQRLANLATKVEQTYDTWINALLNDLDDPVIQDHLNLLKPAERKLVDDFRADKALPDPLPPKLVTTLQQALSGLSRVAVSSEKLFAAIFPGGAPATVDEVKERFTQFTDEIVKGQDRSKVRLVLETTSSSSPDQAQ
jgi:energy-coupling factor transporter ATP-binding protein EcfA2